MNTIEEKIKKARKLQRELDKLWEEVRVEKQENCQHNGWVEWRAPNMNLHRTCPLCEAVEAYNDLAGEWPS